jgi:ketosteroid isomerase-like protein
MATVAEVLREALSHGDLELLGTVLAPDVRWGGEEDTPDTCHTREDVLAWYGRARAEGMGATLEEFIVQGAAVVAGLRVHRPARGPRADGPDRVWQVYSLRGGQVGEIRGYPDRDDALAFAFGLHAQ